MTTPETDLSWHGIYNHQLKLTQIKDVVDLEWNFNIPVWIHYIKPLEMVDSTREISGLLTRQVVNNSRLSLQIGVRATDYFLHDNIHRPELIKIFCVRTCHLKCLLVGTISF